MATPMGPPMPGQQPTPEQIAEMQRQLAAEAQKHGMSPQQYIEHLKAQAMRQHQMQQQQQMQHQHHQQQQVPINPGPPKPEALAVANFLRSQELKPRTCIFQEKRKDMFKVKRAIRALQSEAYVKARSKNALLPEVTNRASAENTFKLLPLSLLALRVSKIDPHEGHSHGKKKRVKGLWTVKIEQHQEARDEFHYIWLYEGSQWKQKFYAAGALVVVFAIVMFPLWPLFMRQGVWYLSMGMLGLIGLFFAMAIFRLILFLITMFTHPPGLWLYPNLFEDVGFFDSFRPIWGWHQDAAAIKEAKKAKKAKKAEKVLKAEAAKANGKVQQTAKAATAAVTAPIPNSIPAPEVALAHPVAGSEGNISAPVTTSGTDAQKKVQGAVSQRKLQASVEEAEDE
ncbi:translocation protein [Patellaria atrata CBS 101060]|uniref:Translocation protein SEC62 n=1 Tax=Patellaria atrata CBS 101060 TaxID=1346257 RepID=A0A9P4SHG5_9PEZI|nr:translocation protein [Patellaria atrata CBS 101060]